MAEAAQTQTNSNPSIYMAPVRFAFHATLMLILTWIFSIMLELIGQLVGWWDGNHSKALLAYEIGILNNLAQASWFAHTPASTSAFLLQYVSAQPISLPQQFAVIAHAYAVVIELGQLIAIRIAIALFSLPLLLMVALVAFADGLVLRDLRRFNAVNESAWIYHWSKRLTRPWVLIPVMLYISLPVSIHPNLIFVPSALVFAAGLRVTTGYFKKVL